MEREEVQEEQEVFQVAQQELELDQEEQPVELEEHPNHQKVTFLAFDCKHHIDCITFDTFIHQSVSNVYNNDSEVVTENVHTKEKN